MKPPPYRENAVPEAGDPPPPPVQDNEALWFFGILGAVLTIGLLCVYFGHRADVARAQERKAVCGEYCDRLIADVPASCHAYCLEGAGAR